MRKIGAYLLLIIFLIIFISLGREKLAAYFCNQGNNYYQQRNYKQAIIYYKNSLKIKPAAWMAHLGLANVYLKSQDYPSSIEECKKALEIDLSCSRAYEVLTDLYYLQGNYEEALRILYKWQEKDPENKKIKQSFESSCYSYFVSVLNESTELFMGQNPQAAISVLKNVLSKCPGNALGYYTLGFYYLSSQDYNNAQISLDKCLAIDPQFYYAYKLLSEVYFKKNDNETAIFYAQKLITLDVQNASVYSDLGLLLVNIERYGQALLYLKEAVRLEPLNIEYNYSLASVYRDNKMLKAAIAGYQKVSLLKDDYPNVHNDLGDIYIVLNMPDQAIKEYQKEIRYCRIKMQDLPNSPILLNNYAHALTGIGNPEQALGIAKNLTIAHPRYRQGYLTLAKIYEKMKKNDLALESLEKANQLSGQAIFINDEILRIKRVVLLQAKKRLKTN